MVNKITNLLKIIWKLVIVLIKEDRVVSWELIDFNLQDKIGPVLNDANFKLKNNQMTDIYTDTLCRFKNVYKQYFSKVLIKLDLFPAIEWTTKILPDKKCWEAIDFSRCFDLVIRNSFEKIYKTKSLRIQQLLWKKLAALLN